MLDILFITADKGLCGAFNHQTIKRVNSLLKKYKDTNIRLSGIGKKGIAYFKYNKVDMINEVENLSSSPDYEKAQEFISKLVKDYEEGRTDKIILVYNGYVNMITQEVVELQLLPVDSSKVVSIAYL